MSSELVPTDRPAAVRPSALTLATGVGGTVVAVVLVLIGTVNPDAGPAAAFGALLGLVSVQFLIVGVYRLTRNIDLAAAALARARD